MGMAPQFGANPFAAPAGVGAPDPYAAAAEAFAAAWRAALGSGMQGSVEDRAAAVSRLSDFLRSRFADLSAFAALGPQRVQQQRSARMVEAALRMQEAQGEIGRLWLDALRDAAGSFAQRCADPAHAATAPAEIYDAWIDCAEDAYARMAHGEAFCTAHAKLIDEQCRLRKHMKTIVELWSKELDLPTRSELNSLHRTVKALRSELARAPPAPVKPAKTARARNKGKPR